MTHQGLTRATLKLILLGFLITSLLGCQATRRGLDFETIAAITFTAEENVNPDADGRSSPIVIRVFKLADARQFQREEFLNLYENANERLGNDLIDTIILKELVPGESRQENIQLSPEVRYLGLLGEYMQYQKAHSVIVVPVKDHQKNTINIRALRLSLIDENNPDTVHQLGSTSDRSGRSADTENFTIRTSTRQNPTNRKPGDNNLEKTIAAAAQERELLSKIKDY